MIIDGLISLPIAVLSAIIGLLPDYTGLPSAMNTSLDFILAQTLAIGDILPTDTIWQVILLTLAIEIGIMAFRTLSWLLHWNQAPQN